MKDNEVLVFGKGEEYQKLFLDTLEVQKKTDVWMRCYLKEVTLYPLDNNPICIPLLKEDKHIICDDEILKEAMESGEKAILVEFPLHGVLTHVPMRSTAFSSVNSRARLSGTSLAKMSATDYCTVMNIGLSLYNEECLVLYRDDKVSAIHSGDKNDYSVLPMYDLMQALLTGMDDLKFKYEFVSGFLDHSYCSASFAIKNKDIVEIYEPFMQKLGYVGKNKLVPVLRFSSSDVATNGANLTPYLTDGKLSIQIGNDLSLTHKNNATVEQFAENVQNVYAIFQASVANLERLEKYKVEYPEDCFANICKKIGAANKYASEALSTFSATRSSTPNGLELYMALWEIITQLQNAGCSESLIFAYQEKLSRVLFFNLETYDKAEKLS